MKTLHQVLNAEAQAMHADAAYKILQLIAEAEYLDNGQDYLPGYVDGLKAALAIINGEN